MTQVDLSNQDGLESGDGERGVRLVWGWGVERVRVRVLLFLLLVQIRPTTRSALAQSHLDEEFKSRQGEAKARRQDGRGLGG